MKQGWEIKKLGDIILENKKSILKSKGNEEGEYPFFISGKKVKTYNKSIIDGHNIYLPTGGNFYVHFYEGKASYSTDTWSIKTKDNTDIKYFYFFLLLNQEYINEKHFKGATIKHLQKNDFREIEIPLPPIEEQKRIVAILDEAFDAVAKAKFNAEQNLKNAKELFESYLQGVFENKGKDWEEKKLIEITNKIGSGATPRGGNESYKTEGISLVRSMNVHDFEFREKNLAFIDEKQAKDLNNVTLQENDVLLNITGASVARCCIIPKEYLPARVNQHVSIIRAKNEIIDPIFLNLLLTSKFYKDQLLFTGEQGATRQAITKAQLEVFKIAFPKNIDEQKSLMSKLGALSNETKKLETIYHQKIYDLEELKKSVLQKAFSGELKTDKT
jgi:type I restriction enzyme S subunit